MMAYLRKHAPEWVEFRRVPRRPAPSVWDLIRRPRDT